MPYIDITIEPIGYPETFDILNWLVENKTEVESGQYIIEIDTEKVSAEIPIHCPGIVHILLHKGKNLPNYTVVGKLEVNDDVYAEYLRQENQIGVVLPLNSKQNEKLHSLSGELSVEQYVINLVIDHLSGDDSE